jgi:hypothetical protein
LTISGKLDEAEKYHRQALEGRKRMFSEIHPVTLTSLVNLASFLSEHGKWLLLANAD